MDLSDSGARPNNAQHRSPPRGGQESSAIGSQQSGQPNYQALDSEPKDNVYPAYEHVEINPHYRASAAGFRFSKEAGWFIGILAVICLGIGLYLLFGPS